MKMRTRSDVSVGVVSVAIASLTLMMSVPVMVMGAQTDLGGAQNVKNGYTRSGSAPVSYAVTGTSITVQFGAGEPPPSTKGASLAVVVVDEGVPNSVFKGNLIARAINKFRFDVTDSGCQPQSAILVMAASAPGQPRTWTTTFTTLGQAGVRKSVEVPLLRTAWKTDFSGNLDQMFAQDIQYVTSLSISIRPGLPSGALATPAQSFKLENFVAINDDGISSSPAALTPLESAFISRFGYGYGSADKLTSDMKTWDADGDGMMDYIEIQSENDEAFANSIFAATDVKMTDNGAEITWTTVKDAVYTVLVTDELGKDFAAVAALSGIQATETGFMTRIDAAAKGKQGPFFYVILKQ